ncbi:unnamed protein product, partial [marine sediment metagenome]
LRPLATKRTIWSLVLGEIAKKEKVKVSDSEIDTEIENMTKLGTRQGFPTLNQLAQRYRELCDKQL